MTGNGTSSLNPFLVSVVSPAANVLVLYASGKSIFPSLNT
jgi:hypothetical protein